MVSTQEFLSTTPSSNVKGVKKGRSWSSYLFVLLVLIITISEFVIITDQRTIGLIDIDEAGYIQFSRIHYLALNNGGVDSFLQSVLAQQVFAPLVPAIGAVFQYISHGSIFASFYVNPLFVGIAVLAVYFSTRLFASITTSWTAGLIVLASPGFLDNALTYKFSAAVAATFALSIYFLLKCKNFGSLTYSLLFGVSLGLMLLSRTMAIAFIPGFIFAGLYLIFREQKQSRFRRIAHAVGGLIAGFLIAGSWYLPNLRGIFDYLGAFGYGKKASEYGSKTQGIFDFESWRSVFTNFAERGLEPSLLIICLLGIFLLITRGVLSSFSAPNHTKFWFAIDSNVIVLSILVMWPFIALASTRNVGSGFWIILPIGLAPLAALGYRSKKLLVSLIPICLLTVLLFVNIGFKAGWFGKNLVEFPNPIGPSFALFDPRIDIEKYLSGTYETGTNDAVSAAEGNWAGASQKLSVEIGKESPNNLVAFGFVHPLFNSNSVELQYSLLFGSNFSVSVMDPGVINDDKNLMNSWLVKERPCLLLVSNNLSGMFEPKLNQHLLLEVALEQNYKSKNELKLPGGGKVVLFKKIENC